MSDSSASEAAPESPAGAVAPAAAVLGLLAGAVLLQGGFYPSDAFGLVLLSVVLVAVGLIWNRDRRGLAVTVAVGGLAVWWLVRAGAAHSPAAFFPFGASLVAFLAAFLIIRALGPLDRTRVAVVVVAIGTALAASGVVGVLGRSTRLAQTVGGSWHASTTLTYPAATAAACAVTLLLALALDLDASLARLAVCLSLAGLLATQSHWDLLALCGGAVLVPVGRWADALWPLALGSAAGLAVVASSTGRGPGWPAVAVVALAVCASLLPLPRPAAGAVRRLAVVAALVAVGAAALLALHLAPTGPTPPPGAQGQTLSWSASADEWRSSVVTGVGPPRVYSGHGSVTTYPGMVPDTYLTVGAGGGLVAAALLLGAGACVTAAIRRRDLLSSCAAAATVAFAVAGCVDFAWQLPAVALLGGCVAGLAAQPPGRAPRAVTEPPVPAARFPSGVTVAIWTLVAASVVAAQFVVGATHQAGGATRAQTAEPLRSATPDRPGRIILTGPDPTDPFMLENGGRYYLYTSEGTGILNVPLRIGTRPGRWGSPVDVLPVLPAWAEGGATWAPDVHRVAGGWGLYFTALLAGVTPLTHCIGSAFSPSPRGPFVPTSGPLICQLDHRGSIDARVFVAPGGRLVMLWKSEDNANPEVPGPDQDGPTGIYAQNLSADGRRLLGRPVRILGPSEPWEGTIVEAPDMVSAWGTYWLIFSGNWYDSPAYGIGVASCQSPLGPCADTDPAPLLGSNQQGVGPGEASLFEDGSAVFLLYNPFRADDPGPVIPRPVDMARLGFTPKGAYLAAP